jgi:hypothetical protein
MAQVLLYADERALAAYLAGAATMVPGLAGATCEALDVVASPTSAQYRGALMFPLDEPRLPPAGEDVRGALVLPAVYDRAAGKLSIESKPAGLRLKAPAADGGRRGARELARALAPFPWARTPDEPLVAYLVRPGAPLAALVTEHLELGKNDMRFAPVLVPADKGKGGAGEPRVLLDVDAPSWFVLERWLPRADDVTVFRRVVGPLGPRRVWVEWGHEHPLEAWLSEPQDDRTLLLIDRAGRHLTLERGALRDVGELLDFDPTRFPTTRLEASGEPERITIPLRLEGRGAARDPELWLLPFAERARLEHLLAATPEEELRNLLVACVMREGGERVFAVREALTGRAPRRLPLGKGAYAPVAGLPNLLVPCHRSIAPPLSNDRYARAFGLKPSELAVCEEEGDEGALRVLRLDERQFKPIEAIIDFVADGEAQRLAELVLAAPFDLGELAEEDLVPAASSEPRRRDEREPAREAPRDDAEATKAGPRVRAREKVKAPVRLAAPEGARPATSAPDPWREEIAALERRLVLERAEPGAWLDLGRLLLDDGQPEEALRAHENALWELRGDDASEATRELEAALGQDPADVASARDTAGLYRHALAFPRAAAAAAASGQAERYRELVERAYAQLRDHEGRLRKKTRWLLWRAVLGETGDAIELERQREDILAELVLRGVEEREVPPFARRVLLEHYGLKAATGSGAAEALQFLERGRAFAAALRHPAMRAEALAHVAWALAELGEGTRALAVAKEAEDQASSAAGAPPHHAFRARAIARVGAVLERASGHGKGAAHLDRALQQIARLLSQEADPRSQESADAHKALVAFVTCLADVRGGGAAPDDPLLTRTLQLLSDRPPERQALALAGAAKDLLRLGAAERGRTMARALLHRPQLGLIYVQDAVAALEVLLGEQPTGPEDADRIVAALLAAPEREPLDEHSIPMLQVALRGVRGSPWDVVERMRQTLLRKNQAYPAALVRIAGLRRLAELRDRQRGAQLLATALDEAWQLPAGSSGAVERMRVVTRLAALVPAFGMRDRGLDLLAHVKERALAEADLYVRNELLMSTAMAASRLGESKSSLDLLEDVATRAIEAFQAAQGGPRRAGTPSWVMFETLDACAQGVAELGDARRGLPLVQRMGDVARGALRQSGGGHDVGRFFYLHSLIQCGHGALALGDAAAAEKAFGDAFTRMREAQGQDLIDLLQKAAETAGQLEGAQRYALARQVLEAAESGGGAGDLFERFTIDLTARIARDMVQGESAFAAALKRWKGREERAIRDRVALERLGPS